MNLHCTLMPERIWIEYQDETDASACDVIVRMEDGAFYSAAFVTPPYFAHQMDLTYQVSKQLEDAPPARYAALETPHVVVPDLSRETIEDTIDNLLALDTFYTLFTPVQDEDAPVEPTPRAKRTTAELAAVVVTDVLRAEPETTVVF